MTSTRGEAGFTLVELLVTMMVAMVIFGATLSVLDAFNHQSAAVTQRDDAQNQARLGIDRIIAQLRNIASPVSTPKLLERATHYDIVFQTVGTPSGANASGAERVRYCMPNDSPAASSTEVLIVETQTWNTAAPPADPWTSNPNATIPCPDSPMPASTTGPIVAVQSVTNRFGGADRPAFTFNNGAAPASLSQVNTVQIDLFVNPTPGTTSAESELRSAAYLRNELRAPVAQFTYSAPGGGSVLLNGGQSYSPDGYDLSYAWSCTTLGGAACPNAATLTGASQGLVSWQPGAGTYVITLTATDPSGLSSPTTQNVIVT
jgi:type II secretory pathway component PulJ